MRKDESSAEDSEDEFSPNEAFVETVEELHREEDLAGWLQTSKDPAKNPLLCIFKDGGIQRADVAAYAEECPQFMKDLISTSKRHGCARYLSDFVTRNYQTELYEEPSLLTSQLQYLQIAITDLSQ